LRARLATGLPLLAVIATVLRGCFGTGAANLRRTQDRLARLNERRKCLNGATCDFGDGGKPQGDGYTSWLLRKLTAHKARSVGTGLVFHNGAGNPWNPSNMRRDVWLPLKKRAKVRDLDLYSLRHSFASLRRSAGESAFNVSRMMGHTKSVLVDQVYAHGMKSGMASVAERVTARALTRHRNCG
jgi:hypothetical protein